MKTEEVIASMKNEFSTLLDEFKNQLINPETKAKLSERASQLLNQWYKKQFGELTAFSLGVKQSIKEPSLLTIVPQNIETACLLCGKSIFGHKPQKIGHTKYQVDFEDGSVFFDSDSNESFWTPKGPIENIVIIPPTLNDNNNEL